MAKVVMMGVALLSSLGAAQSNIAQIVNDLPRQYAEVVECTQAACPRQFNLCDNGCVEALLNCLGECGSGQTCWLKCLPGKGSLSAMNAAICSYSQGCLNKFASKLPSQYQTYNQQLPNLDNPLIAIEDLPEQYRRVVECALPACPSEASTCASDQRCVNSLFNCFSKCKSGQQCWLQCLTSQNNMPAINQALCAYTSGCLKEFI